MTILPSTNNSGDDSLSGNLTTSTIKILHYLAFNVLKICLHKYAWYVDGNIRLRLIVRIN
jgi:hypothetical protein